MDFFAALPSLFQGSQVNRELDRLEAERSKLVDEMIAAGRGHERPSHYLRIDPSTDDLARRMQILSRRQNELMDEVVRRVGPGQYRIPRGWRFKYAAEAEDEPVAKYTYAVGERVGFVESKRETGVIVSRDRDGYTFVLEGDRDVGRKYWTRADNIRPLRRHAKEQVQDDSPTAGPPAKETQ